MMESALKLEPAVGVSNAADAPVERKRYVDVFRGLLVTPVCPSRRAQARRSAGRLISAHVYERTRERHCQSPL